MKTKKVFWGLFLILAGAYLIVSQMGYLPTVGVVRALLTIACAAVFIKSIACMSFGGMLFPLAIIAILYAKPLGIKMVTPWSILAAALLLTIGLNLLFGGWKKKHRKHNWEHSHEWKHEHEWEHEHEMFGSSESVEAGENIEIDTTFNGVIRYITTENFRYASIDSKFSGVKIYFQDAKGPTGSAVIDLDVMFSGIELYVPVNWQVINHLKGSFQGVNHKGKEPEEADTVLTLEGMARFSGVEVHYM